MKMYAYLDGEGCVNGSNGNYFYDTLKEVSHISTLQDMTPFQLGVTGVPQRVYNSGLCWYCAMCFIMLFSKEMRELIISRSSGKLREFLSKNVLSELKHAEELRHFLYSSIALGDRPGQAPHLDGQNGFAQFCILVAHLKIPMVRFFAPEMIPLTDDIQDQNGKMHKLIPPTFNVPSFLVVRCFRAKWQPHRRIVYKNIRYRLVAIMIGSEHCGHQIGASTCDSRVCRWALSDSDGAQHGIGPMFWSITQKKTETRQAFKKRWREMWDTVIPAIHFGSGQVCDLNPSNRPTHELERLRQRQSHKAKPGVVNTDWIYLHNP
jgi:hypothetical protein